MRLEIRKFLYDVQQACELLGQFTEGKSLTDYLSDPLLRSAVERQLMIVGEALYQAFHEDSTGSGTSPGRQLTGRTGPR